MPALDSEILASLATFKVKTFQGRRSASNKWWTAEARRVAASAAACAVVTREERTLVMRAVSKAATQHPDAPPSSRHFQQAFVKSIRDEKLPAQLANGYLKSWLHELGPMADALPGGGGMSPHSEAEGQASRTASEANTQPPPRRNWSETTRTLALAGTRYINSIPRSHVARVEEAAHGLIRDVEPDLGLEGDLKHFIEVAFRRLCEQGMPEKHARTACKAWASTPPVRTRRQRAESQTSPAPRPTVPRALDPVPNPDAKNTANSLPQGLEPLSDEESARRIRSLRSLTYPSYFVGGLAALRTCLQRLESISTPNLQVLRGAINNKFMIIVRRSAGQEIDRHRPRNGSEALRVAGLLPAVHGLAYIVETEELLAWEALPDSVRTSTVTIEQLSRFLSMDEAPAIFHEYTTRQTRDGVETHTHLLSGIASALHLRTSHITPLRALRGGVVDADWAEAHRRRMKHPRTHGVREHVRHLPNGKVTVVSEHQRGGGRGKKQPRTTTITQRRRGR